MTPTVHVVGGGLVGAAVLLFLQRHGIEAVAHEAAPAAPDIGGVIGLEHPALHHLETAGIPQNDIVYEPSERVLSIDLHGGVETQRRSWAYPGRTTTWPILHRAMLDRVTPGTYLTGHKVTSITEDRVNGVPVARLHCSNGETFHADVVVGAPGRDSWMRHQFDPGRTLRYAGYVAHRGHRPGCPPELARAFVQTHTPGCVLNTFPIPGAGGLSVDWTFYLNMTRALYRRYFGATPEDLPFVPPGAYGEPARAFVRDAAVRLLPAHEAGLVTGTPKPWAVPVFDIDPPSRMVWPVGTSRVVLIGDALGLPRPHTGRGANAGIEQAADLASVLRQHVRWGADLDAGLAAMERRQVPAIGEALRHGPKLGASMGLGMPSEALAQAS